MKYLGMILFVVLSASVHSLPKYAETRVYYSDATFTTVVGKWVSGCTARSIHFKGERTSFIQSDPVKHDCGSIGNVRFSSGLTNCFTAHSFVMSDANNDGYIDGYRDLDRCVNGYWMQPFAFML